MVASKQGGRAERERRERQTQRFVQGVDRQNRLEQREAEKAERERERAEKQTARERAGAYVQQQQAVAAARTRAVQARVDELSRLLSGGLNDNGSTGFEDLRRIYDPIPFAPRAPSAAVASLPRWEEFEPPAPTGLGKLLRKGHEQKVAEARIAFAEAQATYATAEDARQSTLADERAQHARAEAQRQQEVQDHNAEIHQLEQLVTAGSAPDVEKYVGPLLDSSPQPEGLPHQVEVAYLPEARRLLITRELPSFEAIPSEREFSYVKVRDEIASKPRPDKEIRQRYADLVAQLTLRTMRDAFRIEPTEIVDEIMISGHVSTRNRATGRPEQPCLVSVFATREDFAELVLEELDAATCLKHLSARVSNNPWELEPVPPVFDPDLSKYRIVDSHDAAVSLDARPVLIEMTPIAFEDLVRSLFEARGLTAWRTRYSRDDGIDAVATNPDPVTGGECIIQAKRYKKVVPVDAVRAMAGTLDQKRATRAFVVTTSWFGKDSHDFVADNRRIQLIEGPELLHLLKEHMNIDALLGVKRPTRRGG